jgi:group I intron endonuclease
MASEKGGIYFIISLVDNKRYVGRSIDIHRRLNEHKRELNKNIHDNKHLQNAWSKYGASNFVFVPFLFCDVTASIIEEQRQLDFYNSQESRLLFNISKSSMAGPSEIEHRSSISEGGRKRAPITEETRAKLKAARARKVFSEEERAKISAASKGRKHTEETRKKLSDKAKGRKLSEEHKKKISEAGKGRVPSEETIKKIAQKNTGKKRTDEARKKMSDAHKGKPVSENAKKHWFKKKNKENEEQEN